ncbi:Asp-domain-containing protein [Venturia nashicola]|uniref:Asp-domain-containing protein n=1 Tax=Venturia nashicola TaxID=86259 RepID=A0A4Z1NT30_9PEZI|nr:Asp-domain-containing protein [Venturia nashicola]
MLSLSLISYAILLGVANGSPTPLEALDQLAAKKTFSLETIEVDREPRSLLDEITHTYLKYNVEMPEYVQIASKLAQDGPDDEGTATTPAKSIGGDKEYLISVQVGNHNLTLDPDTGSADLWVMSNLQPATERTGRPTSRVYDTAGGKSLDGHSWTIRYGDKSGANGKVYLDKVSIGDLTVPNQAVEAASTVSRIFSKDPANDGLLGLAFSKINTIRPAKQATWFDNIKPKLAAPLFAVSLKRKAVGAYDFGYIDKKKYTGELIYANVKGTKGFWDFPVTGFSVGSGQEIPVTLNAIADTGSSLWYVPAKVADTYYAKVQGASFSALTGGWTFPCNAKLPDISLTISGKKLTVPGINMNYQSIGSTCMGGMQRDTGMPFSIAGDVFLKNMFVVFEHPVGGQPRLGFAPATAAAR